MSGKTIYNYLRFPMKGELKKLALSGLREKAAEGWRSGGKAG
jgi:hypothetical protein